MFTLVTNYGLNKTLLLQTRTDNQANQNEGRWLEIFHPLIRTRKATGSTSVQVICQEIKQVTPKCQMDFFNKTWNKRSKTEQVHITIEFYIFEIV